MSKDFENKVALVTGGAGDGIGSHTVRRIAQEGGLVAVVDIHEKRCRRVAEEIAAETGARVEAFPGEIRSVTFGKPTASRAWHSRLLSTYASRGSPPRSPFCRSGPTEPHPYELQSRSTSA